MAISKHIDDTPSSENNKKQYPVSTDRTNEEQELLNDEKLQAGKEKYIRESANIEDLRGTAAEPVDENSKHLTDQPREEKDEENIYTDERKKTSSK